MVERFADVAALCCETLSRFFKFRRRHTGVVVIAVSAYQ